ncbi:MAG: purine-binding chemotaxis protein CheW [Verrucomicrobia bacterium]|nr:purine-binding chemotaxis protein CheW [Verrucomicrobiota bacterium]
MTPPTDSQAGNRLLVLRTGALRCALPLCHVVETMRPLPAQPVANAPAFVSGAAVVRGEALPVVDLGSLLGASAGKPARFVVVRAGERKVVLAVEAVVGIHELPGGTLAGVPPLLSQAEAGIITAIGSLDQELLLVLQAARIVPDEVWAALAGSEAR